MELLGFATNSMPSILKDPFSRNRIDRIYISWRPSTSKCYGSVEFKNGSTKGEQEFEGETFDEVTLKMKSFIEEIKKD